MKHRMICALMSMCFTLSLVAQNYQEWSEQAVHAIDQDSLSKAETCIRKALQLEPANPHNALLFSNLGTIQRKQNRLEEALESYTFALNIAPRTVVILLNRATLLMQLGKENAASADYSLVLDVKPDNQEALLMRAYINTQRHDYRAARADYVHLLRLIPLDFKARLGMATLARKEGKYEESLQLLNQMLNEYEEIVVSDKQAKAMLLVARAGVERDLLHYELAMLDLEDALRLDTKQAEAYLLRGQIYLAKGMNRLAKRDFEKAVELGIPSSDIRELWDAAVKSAR